MIYTEMTRKAMRIAYEAHHLQVDKTNVPYIYHPMMVASMQKDEITTTIALLHDVVEDTSITLDDLAKEFPDEVIEALALLTHKKNEDYFSYVERIKNNPYAKAVKLADLTHNSDTTRLEVIDEKAQKRLAKYQKAIQLLSE